MIRLKKRERGVYVERFKAGVWHLLTIVDTEPQALAYIKSNFKGEIHVQLLSSKSEGSEGKTGEG